MTREASASPIACAPGRGSRLLPDRATFLSPFILLVPFVRWFAGAHANNCPHETARVTYIWRMSLVGLRSEASTQIFGLFRMPKNVCAGETSSNCDRVQ